MFGVREGAEVQVIKDRKDWAYPKNWTNHVTKEFNVFDKTELAIDPTGIARWACGPSDMITIGGTYAKAGYYGFTRDGWTMVVHPKDVEYKGHPVLAD